MKFSHAGLSPLAAALLALVAPIGSVAIAQTTATTTPVGFFTLTVPKAVDASTPSSAALSLPLYNTPIFQSSVATVDSSTSFTLSNAAFTAGQFTSAPAFAHIKAGAQVGRFFLIQSNTATQLTVDTLGANLTSLLAPADSVEIIPANTLASLFGATATGFQTGASFDVADNVYLWNGTTFDTYYNNGTNWKKTGSLINQNNAVLYPDEGVFISRRSTASDLTLTLMGTVPSTTERTDLAAHDASGHGSSFFSNRFPVNIQLGNVGFQSTAGWVSGASATGSDNVFIFNGLTWDTYYYNGTNWKKSGNLLTQDNTVIAAGTAVFVTRNGASLATLAQALPYTP